MTSTQNICCMSGQHRLNIPPAHNEGKLKVMAEKEYHQKGPLIMEINIHIHADNYCNSRQIPAISAAGKKQGFGYYKLLIIQPLLAERLWLLLTNINIGVSIEPRAQTMFF